MSKKTKVCSKCKETKNVSCFRKRKNSKDGHRGVCKNCMNTEENRKKNNAYKLDRYHKNLEKSRQQGRNSYKKYREHILNYQKKYAEDNKEKIAEYQKKYAEDNKKKLKKYIRDYLKKTNYQAKKYQNDPLFRLKCIYRTSTRTAFNSIKKKKNTLSLKLLGCSWQELQQHLSAQFYDHPETGEKMTISNHGLHGWHIDHIIPLDSAKTEEDIIKLCHYTNLQPLWAEENIKKSNKILDGIEKIV
jgi:hypothetical protein